MRFVASVVIQPSGPGLKPLSDDAKLAAGGLREAGEAARSAGGAVVDLEGKVEGLGHAMEGLAGLLAFEKLKEGIEKGVQAVIESRESFAQLEAGVRSTGGAAGFTAQGLRDLAEQQQKLTGINHETVEGAESILLTFTRIGKQVFPQATAAALDLATRMKEDASTAALQLGKALNEPIAGATALRRIGVQLSDSQVEQIKKFAALHDIVGADNIILQEMQKEFGGSAAAMHEAKGGLDDLHNAAQELWEQFGQALLPAVQQLAKEFTALAQDPAFLQEITDAGHSLGEVLLAAGHAAEFLVNHWELLKLAFVAFIALKAPAHILEVVEAVKALTIASRAAALSNPLAWVAIGLLAVNDFVVKMRDAEDAALQANVQLGNQSGLVQALTTDYGNLTAAQLENAKAQLDQLQARNRVLQQQREELLQQAGYSQAGQTPGRQAPPSVRNVDKAAVDDLLKKEHELAIEQGNIQNILKNMSPVLEEHEKHLKSTAAATSDWGVKTKATTDKVKEALETAAEALRREQELTEARYKGVDVLKLQTIVLDGLKKAQSLGAGATDEQRLAMFRLTVQTEQAKEASKSYEATVKDLGEITKGFLKDSKDLADAMAKIRDIGASFLADTLKENQKQVEKGSATMTETVKAHLEEIKKAEEALKEPWISLGQSIQQTLESSVAGALSGVQVNWHNVLQSIWQDFLQTAIHALDEWLKIWIAHMLEAKAAEAVLSGGSPGTTTSGVGGGIYQGAFNAGSAYLAHGGTAAGTGATGASSGSIGGVSYGSLAGAGVVVAAFIAAYFVVKTWIDHHRRDLEQIRITGSDGQISWVLGSATAGADHLGAVADEMVKTVSGIIRNLGGIMLGWTGDLTVSRTGHGKDTDYWVQFANGIVEHFGNDAQAAFQFAMVQAVKQSQVGGLPAEVRAAIQKSTATTVDQLNAEIASAFEKVATRLGDTGYKVFQIFQKYALNIDDEIRKALTSLKEVPSLSSRFGGGLSGGAGEAPGLDNGGLPSKAGGRLPVEATIEEVKAVADLVAARNREVEAIRNSLIGVDDSGAQRLSQIDSFNKGIQESRAVVQAEIDYVQQQLAALGDKTGEQADKLRAALEGYLAQLGKIPEAISGQQLDMAIFSVLDQFLPHTRKYDLERVRFAKMEADYKLQEIKLELIRMGEWEKWSAVWQDAYNNAMAQAGKPPGGHGGGQNRAQAEKDWQTTLQGILDAGQPLLAQWHQLQQSQQDLRDKAKAAHASAAELAAGLAALDAQFKASVRAQAYQLAGIGTDFTKSLQDGLDFFKQLRDLGRAKTGIPDWLREVMEGKFLDKMKATWTQGVLQLAGISDPFSQINQQADELRQNLVALAAASGMTADQVLAASVAIDHAAQMAKEAAGQALEEKLFEPLKDLPQWQGKIVELKKQEVELQYEILKAELQAAGLWEKDKGVWQASHDAAIAIAGAVEKSAQLTHQQYLDAVQQDRNMVAGYDLVKAQQDAAAKFRDLVRGLVDANRQLLTGSQSSLSPQEKYQTALADYQKTLAAAKGGDSQAIADIVGIRNNLLQVAQQYFAGGAGEGLGAGYDALLRQTVQDFANLALSPDVEQKTMTDLLAKANTTAEAVGAQVHADLVGLRQDMVSLLQGYQVGNILGGPKAFGDANLYGGNGAPAPALPFTGSSGGKSVDDVVAELGALRSEVAALRRERTTDARTDQGYLETLADNASDEKAARSRQRAA